MAITKQPTGQWLADIRPGSSYGKRYRKTFKTKAEAERWAAWLTTKQTQDAEWNPKPKKKDPRRLSDLITSWHKLHGHQLAEGDARKQKLLNLANAIGDPLAVDVTSARFSEYRKERIEAGVSANTINHEHAYLRAVFNELERLDEWKHPNPLRRVRKLKTHEKELTFLNEEQVLHLLETLDSGNYADAPTIARICLSTGARWSEAEALERNQIHADHIQYRKTKSGKVRAVPITDCLSRTLRKYGPGRLFAPSYKAFAQAIDASGIHLPDGQLTHVLRHTFASHFMQRGGNILALQKLLGHSTLTMTMRYAHLAPEHLAEARQLNPLA